MKTYGQKTLEQTQEVCQHISTLRHAYKGKKELTVAEIEDLDYSLEKIEDEIQAIGYKLRKLFRVGEI